ncbi:MAG: NAD(P)-dependent oxidoreductase [Eubacteriales bacterium]|nr:NAD(P)-dependent oxidoreductase [Eubacteriales bacterium]
MKKVVITGPTGAIGTALIDRLVKENVQVIAVVRPGSARAERICENDYVIKAECNLDNLSELPALVMETELKHGWNYEEKPDVFYHFGWDGTFGNSRNNMYGQNLNVKYSLDAVTAAADIGCRTFVGAGSQAEYGRFEGKLNGSVPVFPENGYGIAKLCAGQMTKILCEQKGLCHIWTRILSIYGPYDGEQTMVMSTIHKLIKGERPVCTAGEQMWDYLYSKDAGLAMYLLGDKGVHGRVYCIGSGQAAPLKSYIEEIRNAAAPDSEIGFGEVPYAEKQVMYLCADITDLIEDTGFKPEYSFKEGIKETVSWCRNFRR